MPVQKVLSIPNPILYQKSKPIDQFDSDIRSLVRTMFDTMYHENGVGLAAVQIGILKRIMVIDLEQAGFIKGVFANPVLVDSSSEMQEGEEGCLSVPGISAPLERPKWVKVAYQNLSGEKQYIEAEMLMARALLHEIDHMDGKVFVDLLESDILDQIKEDIETIKKGKKLKSPKIPEYRKHKVFS